MFTKGGSTSAAIAADMASNGAVTANNNFCI